MHLKCKINTLKSKRRKRAQDLGLGNKFLDFVPKVKLERHHKRSLKEEQNTHY